MTVTENIRTTRINDCLTRAAEFAAAIPTLAQDHPDVSAETIAQGIAAFEGAHANNIRLAELAADAPAEDELILTVVFRRGKYNRDEITLSRRGLATHTAGAWNVAIRTGDGAGEYNERVFLDLVAARAYANATYSAYIAKGQKVISITHG